MRKTMQDGMVSPFNRAHSARYTSWPGLTAGAGVFLVGQREGNNANDFQLPGYGRVDASLGYSWRIGPTQVTAQFNMENLLDKEYFASTSFGSRLNILPGAPRTFLGSIRVEF